MWRLLTLTLLYVMPAVNAWADDTRTGIFDNRFRTLQVGLAGRDMLPAVMTLGGNDTIVIGFDELTEDNSYLRYSLTHCDASWRPSPLVYSEYIDGFNEGSVTDFELSEATTVHYVHYRIVIPNDDIRIKLSGNYLLKVYREENPDNTLLQARFSVSEDCIGVAAEVTSRTDIDNNDRHQQLKLTVDAGRAGIRDLYSDLKIEVSQNGRLDNVVMLTSPQRVTGDKAYYEHVRQLIFPAGNEYRRFETSSVTYPGMNVAAITYSEPYYHADLYADVVRAGQPYAYDMTQHGRYRIREYDSSESDTRADYVLTHFALDSRRMTGYDIYIDGDLGYRRFSPDTRMHYNDELSQYEAVMLLKQGAYNYCYLAVPAGSDRGFTSVIEGDFHQAVNEYTIKVYYRAPGARYDRLLGITTIFSGK